MIKKAGGEATFIRCNVADATDVQNLVAKTVEIYGGLHCAFNNAGILCPSIPMADVGDDVFDRVMAVDVRGVFLCLKHELKYMSTHGGGVIVNTASIGGMVGGMSVGPYVAAKHAVVGLTKSACLDYGKQGIRVNALCPGMVETPMTTHWSADPAVNAALTANIPMGRFSTPDEQANAVLFLLSDMATYATGAPFVIDGGQIAQ